ncbi:PIN domain-containing protein [Bifidobacterium leontopitheci]|uniref:Twitching motility protein PilT n=1 Tax=Bifidobacterium leontopitheci TaxID=2650774 RepID=A0A6I1GTA8_9BIFI|nr:PIN domain-containing protein [Bifidobacterium leontopitheci]KAB7789701.1 twitching motility protein PilT [Bifidobacterium leontopitheci]
MKLLFDTNILLDVCDDKRVPFHEHGIMLLERTVLHPDIEIMASVASLNDVYYVLRRRFADERASREVIGKLMGILEIRPLLERHVRTAYASDEPDFEDGLIRAVAEDSGVDIIVTRDAKAFQHCAIPSMDAAQCLAALRKDARP